ncbi:MAG: HD domain-containing phosphohydrolase [Bdellovibrionales bacterium]|jgi:HD-GYP domain-containing protein (c-di-GMP phosphodiesterase class II)
MSGAYKTIRQPIPRPYEARSSERMSQTVTAMCKATSWDAYQVDIKNTIHHQNRVALLSFEIATRLGLPDQARSTLYYAAQYHDIGKLQLAPSTLFKRGDLSPQEFESVKQHASNSYEILSRAKGLAHATSVALIARQHHERLDGSGYPFGLTESRITQEAKILAVADVYDALTNERCYKGAMGNERALAILENGIGSKFDSTVFHALEEVIALSMAPRLQPLFPLLPSRTSAPSGLYVANTNRSLVFH